MDLIIVRHGEPDLSGDLTDPPLTALGRRQAQATAELLASTSLDAVYVSPQRRAVETAEPLVAQREVDPITEQRVAEFDFELGGYLSPAAFHGMNQAAISAKLEEYQGPHFQDRVLDGFAHIIDSHPGQTVAVVCHGGVVNVMVREVLGSTTPVGANHASITRVAASRSGVRSLISFNEHHWIPTA